MADKRPWFKLDVGYLSNPKIAVLLEDQPRAVLLHLQCIAYSKQHQTDGVVPMQVAMRLACAMQCNADALVDAGLLTDLGGGRAAVHDYLDHQTSSDDEKQVSEARSRAARARWNANGMQDASGVHSNLDTGSNAEKRREEKKKDMSADADRFDEFWTAYPSRAPHTNPKKPARAKFLTATKKTDPDVIIAAAKRYAQTRAGQDPQHTAMAQTWLNQERWADDTTATTASSRVRTPDGRLHHPEDGPPPWTPPEAPEDWTGTWRDWCQQAQREHFAEIGWDPDRKAWVAA